MKPIGLASDHAGFELKQYVKQWLEAKGWEYKDFGTYTAESCDYADFAHPLALAVEAGECYPGIAICGSGEGISMTLNKHQGIRAALCWIPEISHLARQHNDANVLVMPGRFIDNEMADKIMTEFFNTDAGTLILADFLSEYKDTKTLSLWIAKSVSVSLCFLYFSRILIGFLYYLGQKSNVFSFFFLYLLSIIINQIITS